ncbi:MAG: prenyltransferase/squalene oxidase repeat-containing protein [Verrucomicrobiota bacterium]
MMNRLHGKLVGAVLAGAVFAAQGAATLVVPDENLSFKNEIQIGIQRGLNWLQQNQNSNGCWSMPELPAMTAMSLLCFKGDPAGRFAKDEPAFIRRGYAFLLANVKPDGGIYHSNYVTYNTAISMLALLAANRAEYDPVILKARRFLVGLQSDFGEPGKMDTPFDGGIGYGSRYKHSDMGNTLAALEALYYSERLVKDAPGKEPELNYEAAIHFLQNCQNLPTHNKQDWVSEDAKDLGGFIYYPGHSMAGGVTNAATGKVSLRSYGSISYGGMLSYLYAHLKSEDPRVKAVLNWLNGNYTVEENPGMGLEGRMFYYHTMAKALSVAGVSELTLKDGKKVAWRRDLAMKLLNLQQRDGSWVNESNRWMEKDPVLASTYCLMALEMAAKGL